LRFGVGKNFLPGEQAHYVLGEFSQEEALQVAPAITQAKEIVHAFCFKGLNLAMNHYNVKKKPSDLK
jgi:PTH1 family peptidyl-tRNA hydrolase